jgi:hypothetical protein
MPKLKLKLFEKESPIDVIAADPHRRTKSTRATTAPLRGSPANRSAPVSGPHIPPTREKKPDSMQTFVADAAAECARNIAIIWANISLTNIKNT